MLFRSDLGSESVGVFLRENSDSLWAAALSFVVIGGFWKDHHRLFEQVTGYTRVVINVNLLWLAGIVFLPLPTVLLVNASGSDRTASVVYIATMLVSMGAMRLQTAVIRRAGLLHPDATVLKVPAWSLWLPTVLMFLALVLAASVPGLGIRALLLVLLELPVGWFRRTRAARA